MRAEAVTAPTGVTDAAARPAVIGAMSEQQSTQAQTTGLGTGSGVQMGRGTSQITGVRRGADAVNRRTGL